MIPSQVEDILRSMFQKGMLKDVPSSWSEDEVVDFMSRLNDPTRISKGKIPERGDEDLVKAPEWARTLSLTLDKLMDIAPVMRRINEERARNAEQTARRTKAFDLETDEEKNLFKGEEEEREYSIKLPPDPLGQHFRDLTQNNMEEPKEPDDLKTQTEGSGWIGDSRVSMKSGTKRKEEARRVGNSPAEAESEELKRRIFNRLQEGQRRENEALQLEREIRALPGRIEDIARRLVQIPFNKWSVRDMTDVERYFTPEQVSWLSDAAEKNTRRRTLE